MYTFKDIRKMLGHETTPIDIVKVDIEAYEWMSVKQMFEVGCRLKLPFECQKIVKNLTFF